MIDINHDFTKINHIHSRTVMADLNQKALAPQRWDNLRTLIPVSYTHLTLPTIYSV